MSKLIKRLRLLKLNNSGVTLVELIVTFALIALFMVQATFVITSTMNIYYEVKGNQMGLQVTDVIISKISGQLEGASGLNFESGEFNDTEGAKALGSIIYSGSEVEFKNNKGSHVKICVDGEGNSTYLALHYYQVVNHNEETDTDEELYKAVDWKYDDAMYMGYHIENLQFVPAGNEYKNVMKVILTVKSPKYGEYTTEQLIKCYNLTETSKIIEGIK